MIWHTLGARVAQKVEVRSSLNKKVGGLISWSSGQGLDPIPADTGPEVECTLDRSPVFYRGQHTEKNICLISDLQSI